MARLDFTIRARDLAQPHARLLQNSSLVEARGENLTESLSRETKFACLDRATGKGNLIGFPPKFPLDDKAVVRGLALPRLATQEKFLVHTSPRKGCRTRRWGCVSRELRDNPLDFIVNFLVLATGYSLGIGSNILDKRPLGTSFIASKSKKSGHWNNKRIRMNVFGSEGVGRKRHHWAIRDKGDASAVESYLINSDAGDAFINRHQIMSMSYDGDRSEDRQSEEVQSAYKKDSDGLEEMIRGYFNLDEAEEQNEENEWSWVPQDGDPIAESISSLQATQEVLERFFKKNEALDSEMQILSQLGLEFVGEDSPDDNVENDVEVDALGMNQKMEHLEQKLKEASNTITEKDLRISELQVLISSVDTLSLQTSPTNIDKLEMELECQLREKIEAEIQCLVMVKARQSWQLRAEDQIALEEHRLSAGGDTRMMLKLRETENKIVMLKEQVDRLEAHERELSGTTEVLMIQSRTFKLGLFGLLQLIMLFMSLKMFFAKDSGPFGDVVPT